VAKETFETSLKKLEELVSRLENGDLTLEESLRCFESGVKRVSRCQELLAAAETRVQQLTRGADGNLEIKPFATEEDA